MFTYYVIAGSDKKVIYCAGYNPSTNVFEFYQSNDGINWQKQVITPIRQEDSETYYEVKTKNANKSITLKEDTNNRNLLLTEKENKKRKALSQNLWVNN